MRPHSLPKLKIKYEILVTFENTVFIYFSCFWYTIVSSIFKENKNFSLRKRYEATKIGVYNKCGTIKQKKLKQRGYVVLY